MTDFHYFTKPDVSNPGTLNPVYEVLDYPIVMGRADDTVVTGDVPETPLVDGREVTDPRLIKALSVPVELDRAEALDRSAKLAGILRAMGVDNGSTRLRIAPDVPAVSRALSILAAMRLGVVVDARTGEVAGGGAGGDGTAGDDDASPVLVDVETIDADPIEPGRASVKVVRSRFEGVGVSIVGQTANLDQAMRDSRVESAEVVALDPNRLLVLTDDGPLTAAESLPWLRETLGTEA
ncbi:hypothetical protein [Brevibacterium metallidurans]|uniref:Uncharacterized protein n=1 Tax=Brevibacterium metallidurans TaxID=1482676 RepID=A0ABP3C774_9MICO